MSKKKGYKVGEIVFVNHLTDGGKPTKDIVKIQFIYDWGDIDLMFPDERINLIVSEDDLERIKWKETIDKTCL